MTTPEQHPTPHSEQELLEQWDFLDRLVERQAAQLRAGFQDTEEADDPSAGAAELEGLRRDLDRLRAELRRAQAAGEVAEAQARRSRDALVALTASHQRQLGESEAARQQAERDRAEAVETLARARLEIESLRAEAAAAHHRRWRFGRR